MLRLSILAFSLMPKSLAIITLTELIMKTVRYQIESLSKSTPLLGLCFDWSELSQTVNWLLWTQVSVFWSLLVHLKKKKREYSKNVCVKVLFLPLWSIYLSIFMYIYLIVFFKSKHVLHQLHSNLLEYILKIFLNRHQVQTYKQYLELAPDYFLDTINGKQPIMPWNSHLNIWK